MSSDSICIDVFKDHWSKALSIINNSTEYNSSEIIFKHVDIMIRIIINQCDEGSTALNDIMEFCDENVIFQTILIHFNRENHPGEIRETGIINQLKVFDNLLNFLSTKQILRKNIIYSMLKLLEECSIRSSVKIEQLSVHLLYQLVILVTRDEEFFSFLKDVSKNHFNESFYFINLIIQMIHRDKDIGRLSQEAMLLVLSHCKNDDNDLVDYMCDRSDFCAIITTVLSGLYSSFPRKLDNLSEDWQQITRSHAHSIPEIVHSLQLLDFINLALKMSHPRIQNEILEFLKNGFLSPVIGPSLHQNSLEETISATAYLELFLRSLHEPLLIRLFLQFILTERKENYIILDSLINRLSSVTMDSVEGMYTLGVVTLSLFRTMLSFHCEDVMFSLVLKYLIPCNHYIKQKWQGLSGLSTRINDSTNISKQQMDQDIDRRMNEDFSNSAEQFLNISLGVYSEESNFVYIPHSTKPVSTDLEQRRASMNPIILDNLKRYSLASPFHSYLQSAALYVNRRILATESWQYSYNGLDSPPPNVFDILDEAMDPRWPQAGAQQHTILLPTHTSSFDPNDYDVDGEASGTQVGVGGYYRHTGISSETVVIIEEEDEVSSNNKHTNDQSNHPKITPKYLRNKRFRAHSNEHSKFDFNQHPITSIKNSNNIIGQFSSNETTPRDIGYFSHSNNGSAGSQKNLSNKSTNHNEEEFSLVKNSAVSAYQLPELLDNDYDGKFQKKRRYTRKTDSNKRTNDFQSSTLQKKLSQSTQSIYKLHYGVYDLSGDEDDDEVAVDIDDGNENDDNNNRTINVKIDDDTNGGFKSISNVEEFESELKERSQINMENVLLSCPEECNLTEFIVSLNLLQIDVDQITEEYRSWTMDFGDDDDVYNILIEHDIDLATEEEDVDDNVYRNEDDDDVHVVGLHQVEIEQHELEEDTISTPTNEANFKRRLQSFDNSLYTSPAHVNSSVTFGPFLTAIFQRLSVLSTNTLFMNLLITGIFTDLASYPHPLIKNLLLDVDVVLQPNISKLYEILVEVRTKLMDHASNINNWETILESAYEYLFYRVSDISLSHLSKSTSGSSTSSSPRRSLTNNHTIIPIIPEDNYSFQLINIDGSINVHSDDFSQIFNISNQQKNNQETKTRRTPFGLLQRKKKREMPQYRFSVSKFNVGRSNRRGSTSSLLVNSKTTEYEPQRCRNLAYSWIVFDEFCKELASLCQEHTLHCFF